MKKIFLTGVLSLIFNNLMFSQGATCAAADPFCTGSTYTFPNNTGIPDAGAGNNYDCLGSTPNPAWYYMEVATSGDIHIDISQENSSGAGIDVDFILYGPYPNLSNALSTCGNMGNGTTNNSVVDCSYDPAPTETADIANAIAGEVYVLLLTNYADEVGTIDFSQTSGSGATDCSIINPCVISGLTATPGACQSGTNTYTVNGAITFTNAPATGTLTVRIAMGIAKYLMHPLPVHKHIV